MRVEPREWEQKKLQRVPEPLPPREDALGRGCHEVGPYLATLAPWSWTSLPPELPEINVCCLQAPQAVACDHDRLRSSGNIPRSPLPSLTLTFFSFLVLVLLCILRERTGEAYWSWGMLGRGGCRFPPRPRKEQA